MADEVTPKLGLTKPEVGASRNTWGDKMNANLDILDSVMAIGDGSSDTYEYVFSTTITEPPGGGQIRLNSDTQISATQMWVSKTTALGNDATNALKYNLKVDRRIFIQDKDNGTQNHLFEVSGAPVDDGTHWDVPISYVEGGSDLPSGQRALMVILQPEGGGGGGGGAIGNAVELSLFAGGVTVANEVLFRHEFTIAVSIPIALVSSQGSSGVAATASTVLSLKKNGTEFGTATWAAAGTNPTFAAASITNFSVSDVLSVVGPAIPDATLADISLSIVGAL